MFASPTDTSHTQIIGAMWPIELTLNGQTVTTVGRGLGFSVQIGSVVKESLFYTLATL
jgi:hypothetical protein